MTKMNLTAHAPRGLSERIRQFTPNWFAVTMGNGIVSLVLGALPVHFAGQHALASALWVIDIVLYLAFSAMLIARATLFPETIRPLLHHPVQSMFLGAVPMGLVPIINGIVLFAGGHAEANALAYTLWCFDAVLSVVVAIGVPFMMFTEQGHAFERVTAVLLLPIVAPEVAASSAATLAPHFVGTQARLLIGAGYVLWAISVPLAFAILTIVFFRLVIHKLPHRDLGASSWLTLGPIGTGALGLLTLGQAAPAAFAGTPLANVALLARDLGMAGALLLWSAGLWWLACAVLFTIRYCREGLPFNLGWWGFTFPLGVYTAASLSLYHATGFGGFAVFGTVLAMLLGGLWAIVIVRTCRGILQGGLFHAPCLAAVSN
ncbi:TDT family transporter [Burkholderia cepacia]|uniref:TDT family transporter n=1 Tax=Burkholderia cepacia TaxID=292 RepID=UPI000758F128|nr:TDT family transporter [Burkholderia cepacia]KVS28278.1 C4-dicarboxylate ABC transporter [Burkholderia cepacia]MCA8117746.1 TDT family transporter [Burkholderia cepacia]MCE4123840.1 TDT family transporter [Burkholderia cepacia]